MVGTNPSHMKCGVCGGEDLEDADDGFFYCRYCGSQADDIIDTGVADEDFVDKTGGLSHGGTALYLAAHKRKASQTQTQTRTHIKNEYPAADDGVGPTEPLDFASDSIFKKAVAREEDYYKVTRRRYVMGVQIMVQLQCEALVKSFGVNPLVCGIAGSIWVRFVASTGVFEEGWAYQAVVESESQSRKSEGTIRNDGELRNIYNQRMVLIWARSLKKAIPLSCSLAVSYLACHIAREPVLPTDLLRWAVEGKLPYFGAFAEIERRMEKLDASIKNIGITLELLDKSIRNVTVSIEKPSILSPLSARSMFRPFQTLYLQKMESMPATIAESIGLSLPPVNFYGIASRYLKQLSLPVEKIISHACRIYEWSMPPDLWLSANELRLPTRVSVMSILIVSIRILYNINGFGKWEMALSAPTGSSSMDDDHVNFDTKDDAEEGSSFQGQDEETEASQSSVHKFESEVADLLLNLEKRYDEINSRHEYSKDLPTYLQYCRDVVFSGSCGDSAEDELIKQFWDVYLKNEEDIEKSMKHETGLNQKRSRDTEEIFSTPLNESKKNKDEELNHLSQDIETSRKHETGLNQKRSRDSEEIFSTPLNDSKKNKDEELNHLSQDIETSRKRETGLNQRSSTGGKDFFSTPLNENKKHRDEESNHLSQDIETSGKHESGLTQRRLRDRKNISITPVNLNKKLTDKKLMDEYGIGASSSESSASSEWRPSDDDEPSTSQANQTKGRKANQTRGCKANQTTGQGEANRTRGQDEANQTRGQGEAKQKASSPSYGDIAIRHLKIDMEEHRFRYIPPRTNVKRRDYLQYGRKYDDGAVAYVAHADYYILLRACAKVAQVDIRIMHWGVLRLEKRLAWIENWIDHCLQKISSHKLGNSQTGQTDEDISLSDLSL